MYKRKCPNCERTVKHKNYCSYRFSIRTNRRCILCRPVQPPNRPKPDTIIRMSKERSGKGNPMYGKHHSKKIKLIIGKASKARIRTPHTEETKKKLRESQLKKSIPNYNPDACRIIDKFGKKHGYMFQHAMNGGEVRVIGYSLDGYDKEKNVVIEYYENVHRKRWRKDLCRKRQIMKYLGCKFIELKEWQ